MRSVGEVEATAYRSSVRETPAVLAGWLLDALGPRMTTAALGLQEANAVRQYARGEAALSADCERRLRLLYRVTRMIADTYSGPVAQAFLRGSNPELDDQSPLLVIAQRPVDAAADEVLGAVHAFLEG